MILGIVILVEDQELLNRSDLTAEEKVQKLRERRVTNKEELKQFDMGIVLQLDEKVNKKSETLLEPVPLRLLKKFGDLRMSGNNFRVF